MDHKSSGFGRFVSFFIQDEELSKISMPEGTASGIPQPTSAPSPTLPTSTGTSEGFVDRKYTEHFEKLLEQANLPGCDYYEFVLALRNMANLGLTEDKLYLATYATFQALGGNTRILLETAHHYIQVLRDNQTEFEHQVKEKTDQSVGTKSREKESLVAANQQYVQQILDLQARIEANDVRMAQLGEEITVETANIQHQQLNYTATLAQFVGKIEADVAKINLYLGNKPF